MIDQHRAGGRAPGLCRVTSLYSLALEERKPVAELAARDGIPVACHCRWRGLRPADSAVVPHRGRLRVAVHGSASGSASSSAPRDPVLPMRRRGRPVGVLPATRPRTCASCGKRCRDRHHRPLPVGALEVSLAPSSLPWAAWSVLPFVTAILRYAVDIDRGAAEASRTSSRTTGVLLVLGALWLVLFSMEPWESDDHTTRLATHPACRAIACCPAGVAPPRHPLAWSRSPRSSMSSRRSPSAVPAAFWPAASEGRTATRRSPAVPRSSTCPPCRRCD